MQVIWKGKWKFIYFLLMVMVSINLQFSFAFNETAYNLLNSELQNPENTTDLTLWPRETIKIRTSLKRIKRNTGPPRNLTGFIFWDDTINIFRLKLTWLPPLNMKNSFGYNLTYFCDPRPCKSGFFIEADLLLKDVKSITIPANEEKDFISLNSTIHIILTVLPYNQKENNSITLQYKVPDCVDNRCYCGHMNQLPRPNMQASFIHNEKVNVSWSTPYKILEKNDSRYHTIHVYISIYNKKKQEYVHDEIVSLKLKDINASHYSILSPKLSPSKDYVGFLHLRDNEGCTTLNATAHILTDDIDYFSHSRLFYALSIIVIVSLILFFTIISIRQHIKKWLKYVCLEKSQSDKRASTDLNFTSNEGYFRLTKLNSTTIPLKRSEVYVSQKNEESNCNEIPFNRLLLLNQIGRGEFGLVYRAYLKESEIETDDKNVVVAVKTLKEYATPEEMNDFVKEIVMFKQLGHHPNIVRLIGYCTIQEPYCMVMEYLANGDLATHLRKLKESWLHAQNKYSIRFHPNKVNRFNFSTTHINKLAKYSSGSVSSTFTLDSSIATSTSRSERPSATETEYILLSSDGSVLLTPNSENESPVIFENIVDSIELQKFALQIAKGMTYLEEKNVTHRDLAARNILIDDHKNLKISDFGLSRSGTYICTKSKLPYRWLSIEALRDQVFTSKSDVWSFGVVLWEIGTLGDFPYSTMENYMQILKYLTEGNRLLKPSSLSDDIYNLMLRCWASEPNDRPTFAEITNDLSSMSVNKIMFVILLILIAWKSLKYDLNNRTGTPGLKYNTTYNVIKEIQYQYT